LIILSIYKLLKDDNKFGFNFYLSGMLWGLSINTKFIGLFLLPMFIYYIFFKGNINSFGYRKLCYFFIKLGTLSILTYLITSPFLYINNNFINIFMKLFDIPDLI